ncbi:Na+/H+ antiporter subunit B [Candidatus Gracilibacteria bacterium]|nr:Na+/H+ antiporter subunit B [Candidatus Gracilibacteria bacterium]
MYDSIILRTVARLLLPLLLLLSLFMLIRGHNLPGGGFIGGLIAACGIILQIVAYGPSYARRVLPYNYLLVAAFGVVFASLSGFPSLLIGAPYMQGLWLPDPIPGIGKVGTPTFFDIGVYIVVVGITTQIAFLLAEEPCFTRSMSASRALRTRLKARHRRREVPGDRGQM